MCVRALYIYIYIKEFENIKFNFMDGDIDISSE